MTVGEDRRSAGSPLRALAWLVVALVVFLLLIPVLVPEVRGELGGGRGLRGLVEPLGWLGLTAVPGLALLGWAAVRRRARSTDRDGGR